MTTNPTSAAISQDMPKRRGVTFGIVLIVIGALILLKSLGGISFFDVDMSFPIVMLIIGVIVGLRSRFRNPAWIFLVLVGLANAIPEFRIGRMESDEVAVALGFILLGAYVMRRRRWQQGGSGGPGWQTQTSYGSETTYGSVHNSTGSAAYSAAGTRTGAASEAPFSINAFALFAGRKEMITSKNFQGGRVTAIFGGTQLNLMNADSTASHIVLDVTAALGGVEITIPSHWELVNEVDAIFGGVDDARMMRTAPTESSKTLVIRGFCLMGGVEIKSY